VSIASCPATVVRLLSRTYCASSGLTTFSKSAKFRLRSSSGPPTASSKVAWGLITCPFLAICISTLGCPPARAARSCVAQGADPESP